MPKGDKYIELTTYLNRIGKAQLRLSFAEIENIIGFELKDSAYLYPAFWSNSKSHAIAFGWINAGYRSANVDIPNRTIEFVKADQGVKLKKRGESCQSSLEVERAIENINIYFNDTLSDIHGRFMSWRHCYNIFTKCCGICDDTTVDYLSLHLAFYLASWGMYRGSTFLLQKDYKVHERVVKIIQEERYNLLRGIGAEDLIKKENLDLLMEISSRIRNAYAEEKPADGKKVNYASDTLITKILLGTFGCVPAYDQFYVKAVKKYGVSCGKYNRNSIIDIAYYYIAHKSEFEPLRKKISESGTEYPPMKLMDMCMWQLGFSEES